MASCCGIYGDGGRPGLRIGVADRRVGEECGKGMGGIGSFASSPVYVNCAELALEPICVIAGALSSIPPSIEANVFSISRILVSSIRIYPAVSYRRAVFLLIGPVLSRAVADRTSREPYLHSKPPPTHLVQAGRRESHLYLRR